MTSMRPFLPTLALFALTTPAFATASIHCEAEDGSVSFSFGMAYGRSAGSPPNNFNGRAVCTSG